MAITFNTNLAALGAQRNIGIASGAASSSLSKLSSGSRVPQAKDDAAGLAIGSKLKSEVAGLTQASNNAAQAISLLQIADGALSTIGDVLQRMKALAVQSSSGQLDDASRSLLNQEFSGLNDEVSRVANLSNFNGTTLLAGSTKVQAKVNDMGAGNLINDGFAAIEFGQNYGDGAIKIEYVAASDIMTVTDLATNKSQSISVAAAAIDVGNTETYNFGDIGVKVTLNSDFDKAANIAGANTVSATRLSSTDATAFSADTGTLGSWALTGPTEVTAAVTTLAFNGTGNDLLNPAILDGLVLTASGAHTAVTLDATIEIGGVTFTRSGGPADTSSAGTDAFTYSDGNNNSFVVSLTTVGNASAGTAAGTITLNLDVAGGAIEATGTGANAPKLTAITQSGVPATNFNFGKLDTNVITFTMADAAAPVASVTIDSVVFNTSNAGGVAPNLESTGVKTLTLADADGNAFTIQFNVTTAFKDGESTTMTMGQFGQVVGADSVTSGSTTFDFKVGSGTSVNDKIAFTLNSATNTALGINSASIGTAATADTAIGLVNSAITAVASRRADIGAAQSRLDFAANSISVSIENTTAAASALLDVDVSAEITNFTNKNVLMQAGISLLGQANQQPALLLRLLQ